MSKQTVDFEQGTELTGDSNERGNGTDGVEAIKPYDDGEPATAAVFDRPIENIRQRSETLRIEMEAQKYLSDSDMRWILTKGLADGSGSGAAEPYITAWNPGTGIFVTSDAVVVQPLDTPPEDMTESVDYGFPSGAPTGTLTITMTRYDYALANLREVHWIPKAAGEITGGVPGFCDFKLLGEEGHILEIWYEETGLATLTDIGSLIAIYGPAGTNVLDPAGFELTLAGSLAPSISPADFDDYAPPGPLPAHYYMYKTFDRELHYIIPASFSDFFLDPANGLQDGDTLAIYFQYFLDPVSTGGRRQRIPGNVNTSVAAAELFNTRVEPGKIPGCIPLCKRIGNDLLWLDGTFVGPTISPIGGLHFGEHGYTVERIYSAPSTVPLSVTSMWYGAALPPAWATGTINDGFNGIIDDLANAAVGTSGVNNIGVEFTNTPHNSLFYYNVPVPGESLNVVLSNILEVLNSKGSLTQGTAFGSEEIVSGRWWLFNHVRLHGQKAFLRSNSITNDYYLVYRNGGHSEVDAGIGWSTYSEYEGTYGRIGVYGGSLNAAGSIVTAPSSGGPGYVNVIFQGHNGEYHLWAAKSGVTASSTLSLMTESDWDMWEFWGSSSQAFHMIGGSAYGTYVRSKFDFTGQSDINIATHPFTRVIDGFFAMGPSNTDPLGLYSTWAANRMLVSSGRAVVNGIPITKSTTTYLTLSSSSSWMTDIVALPSDDATADIPFGTPGIPGWYYLWLRSDGNFFIGKAPPSGDYAFTTGHTPGLTMYRPSAGEHAVDGYTAADYVLCDVIMLVRYDGGTNWYWDNAPCIGGSFRRLRHRYAGGEINWRFDTTTTSPSTGDISLFVNNGTFSRCPGLPLGITSNARIGYATQVGVDHVVGAGVDWHLAHASNLDLTFYPKSGNGYLLRKSWRAVASSDGAYVGADVDDAGEVDVYVENVYSADYGKIYRSLLFSGGTTSCILYLDLVGFYWDRDTGGSCWHG